jgi:hypothetical protein
MRSRFVSEVELRRIFNEYRYFERMQEGEFHSHIVKQSRRRGGGPRVRNAMSQTVEYRDKQGRRVALVHQYRMRDGRLGGSGKPDPKVVVHDETIYFLAEGEDWDLPEW